MDIARESKPTAPAAQSLHRAKVEDPGKATQPGSLTLTNFAGTVLINGPSNTASLEALQSEEQRLVLDTVAEVRKCGLESILALPQLVVCSNQSARKSSVLEALTEIPFPRNNKLCTRFATKIIMRRATVNSLTIKVIPDNERPSVEKELIQAFMEKITDFKELPEIIDKAIIIIGIGGTKSESSAFAKDVLSVEIKGPTRPQLTLVNLPGLIQNETKGVTKADVELVWEITDRYNLSISHHLSSRCLRHQRLR